MKQFIASASLSALAGAEALLNCMYCRRNDENSGFLNSWSYCKDDPPTCLHNQWNYISRPCETGWKKGASYDLDFCEPEDISCPEFESDPEK